MVRLNRVVLPVKLDDPNARVPTKANPSDAGYDLYALFGGVILPGDRMVVDTGIKIALPKGHVGLIWPRSGLAVKSGIDTLAGVVDSGYRNRVGVVLVNHGKEAFHFNAGDRVAQLLIQEIKTLAIAVMDELPSSDRGTAGFGSSGN